jgi:hypothetical protein
MLILIIVLVAGKTLLFASYPRTYVNLTLYIPIGKAALIVNFPMPKSLPLEIVILGFVSSLKTSAVQ